jgi:hypothetical protein
MKPSSRSGRFKKKLVSEEQLLIEAPLIEKKMIFYRELHQSKIISDCELCGIYLIYILSLRFPYSWLGSKRKSISSEHHLNFKLSPTDFPPNIQTRINDLTLGEIFNTFALKSTPESVNRAIIQWSMGHYPLELMFRIPGPLEVLDQQKNGRRCVTVLTKENQIKKFILGERDSLSFTMHDLIHADHFYFHNTCYFGQIALYGFLSDHRENFKELLGNPDFFSEFEYLIADMNAYAIHSLKCLKSAIIHYGSNEWFENWVKSFEVAEELLLLNSPAYVPELYDPKILEWLNQFRKI